jgi:hypothetical protein
MKGTVDTDAASGQRLRTRSIVVDANDPIVIVSTMTSPCAVKTCEGVDTSQAIRQGG